MDDYGILKESKWVNSKWYLEQYPDVALLGMDPIEHYLRIGARLGRDPCKRFSTSYYLKAYPDVAKSGLNPLVHWVLYGQSEGRDARPNGFQSWIDALWQGHSKTALQHLEKMVKAERIYSPGERWNALWHLARWAFFDGDHQRALELAIQMDDVDPSRRLRKERVLLIACCYQLLGQVEAGIPLIEDYVAGYGFDPDIQLVRANAAAHESERLRLINDLYRHYDLHTLSKWTDDAPLTLHNLHGDQPVADIPFQAEKVSIIIPAFNAESRIEVVLNSLLNQTWRNIEIIVVDDCSDDRTLDIVRAVAERDSRVVPVAQEQNGGAYRARNRGLMVATGDYITTHDSDDWSHPQKLETQVLALQANPELMGVALHWVRATEQMIFTQNWRPNKELIHWSQSSFMFRKQVVSDIGQWDEVRIGGDTEFIWRVEARYGKDAVAKLHPEIPFAFALDDEGSLTRTKATHVRTVYFGLRHIYRAVGKWWHRTHDQLHVADERPFAAPVSMVDRSGATLTLDTLLVGDFADAKHTRILLAKAKVLAAQGERVGVFHWPTFGAESAEPRDEYCAAVYHEEVMPVVFGDPVAVEQVLVINKAHVRAPLDALPNFEHVGQVKSLLSSEADQQATELRNVFIHG